MSVLRLRKREDRRVVSGHDWVFSNEIDTSYSPLANLEPGQAVIVESASGKFLGHAYANPHSLITARITSRSARQPFSAQLLRQRLSTALALRDTRYAKPCYRLVYSEADYLPGLVIDRYEDVFVVQITTAGMEHYVDAIVDGICSISGRASVYLRNDSAMRDLESLPRYCKWAAGDIIEQLSLEENGLHFTVPAEISQKTGWYYDHRESRLSLAAWVKGKRVLDVYSYVGAFGINAAAHGAQNVLALDASEQALEAARHNALLNGVDKQFSTLCGDAVEGMRSLFEEGEKFDVVILDPPAFIKRRKDRENGLRHYALNNRLAMRLLQPGGILLSASCSQQLSQHDLLQQIRKSAPARRQGVQVLAPLQQAPDHPVHIAMPETLYLSGAVVRVI